MNIQESGALNIQEIKNSKESIIDVRLHVAVSRRALEKWFAYADRYLRNLTILELKEREVPANE